MKEATEKQVRIVLFFAIVLPLLLVAFFSFGTEPVFKRVPYQYSLQNGDTLFHQMADANLYQIDGDSLYTESLLGNIFLLSFFSAETDSIKAQVMHGNLQRIYENIDWEEKPAMKFVSINTGDSLPAVRRFMKRLDQIDPTHWIFAQMPPNHLSEVIQSLQVKDLANMPDSPFTSSYTLLLDKEGKVRKQFMMTDLSQERKLQESIVALWQLDYPGDLGKSPYKIDGFDEE